MQLPRSPRFSKHSTEAGKWLLWACVLGLAPIWLSVGFLAFLAEGGQIPDLFARGQLALYAASLAGTSMYLASIDRNPPGMRWRSTLNLLSLVIWIVATGTYVVVGVLAIVTQKLGTPVEVDAVPIVIVSVCAYVASAVTAFFATVIDNERLEQQYEAIQAEQTKSLATGVRELGQ